MAHAREWVHAYGMHFRVSMMSFQDSLLRSWWYPENINRSRALWGEVGLAWVAFGRSRAFWLFPSWTGVLCQTVHPPSTLPASLATPLFRHSKICHSCLYSGVDCSFTKRGNCTTTDDHHASGCVIDSTQTTVVVDGIQTLTPLTLFACSC